MINKLTLACIFVLNLLIINGTVYADSAPSPQASNFNATKQSEFFGSKVGANVTSGTGLQTSQLAGAVNINILGIVLQALFAEITPPNTYDGVTYNEVYSFGKRVFANAITVNGSNGAISVGLAPTEVRVPLFEYPIGPMILELDAGARFQAGFVLQNMTVIGVPVSLSSIGVNMQGNAMAAGFAEGYAKFFVVRGGVGGQFDLVDAKLDASARINFDGSSPNYFVSGMASFLNGQIYAFGDIYNIFAGGWSRFIDKNLYTWNGYCFSAGSMACPVN